MNKIKLDAILFRKVSWSPIPKMELPACPVSSAHIALYYFLLTCLWSLLPLRSLRVSPEFSPPAAAAQPSQRRSVRAWCRESRGVQWGGTGNSVLSRVDMEGGRGNLRIYFFLLCVSTCMQCQLW